MALPSYQPATENERLTKAAGIVGSATFLSRIFGLIRDIVLAWFFGAGLISDAFLVAFRIPNTLRRLFAEGSLSIAFIPVFTEYLAQAGKEEAFKMARSTLRFLSILLVGVIVVGILAAPLIIRIIAWGFSDSPEKYVLTVFLTRIMFPYIFFISLVALSMGILNALGHFTAPALAPVFLNIAMICSVFLISPYTENPVTGLAVGVLIGGGLQLALQVPFLIKKGFYFWQRATLYHPGIKKVGVLMLPAVFGAAVYQVNIFVDIFLASFLKHGSISYLYYADRLVQFPLGIFAIATATAVLPSLSRQATQKDLTDFKNTLDYAVKLVFFIIIPSMVGLIVLREPIIALLFKRGAFDSETTRLTAYALLYYAIGLWAVSAVRIIVNAFYALQDTKTPVRMAVISVGAKIALSLILMRWLAHGGLALSTSLASMLNLGLLVQALSKKLGGVGWQGIKASVFKTSICSLVMGAVVWALAFFIIPSKGATLTSLFFGLLGSILAGIVFYGAFSFFLKSQELKKVLVLLFNRVAINESIVQKET